VQAGVNVFFQARYGQSALEGSAEAAEFVAVSRICRSVMLHAPHYGPALLHTVSRSMLDMIHMDPGHFGDCCEAGMPSAFVQMLISGVPS
jgi:hypothetical protein